MRLHKFIGQSGLTSRRKAEELILEGRVAVNGETVQKLGVSVGEDDVIEVDGKVISLPAAAYFVLNKPTGFVSTMSDPEGRRTVAHLMPRGVVGLKPVGRLDAATSGLMLLSNDGAFAARATHARHGLEKEYRATVNREPDSRDLDRLLSGVYSEGETLRARAAALTRSESSKHRAVVTLVLVEGRNRQVRRMLDLVGCPVFELERVRIGPLRIRGMHPGECRKLSQTEVAAIERAMKPRTPSR